MKKLFGISLLLLALSPVQAALAGCLKYEPEIVSISGIVDRQIYPGRPNYESVEDGDEPVSVWVLKLNSPICVLGSNEIDVEEMGQAEVQMVLDGKQYKKYQSLVGKNVVVLGRLFHSHSGHHYRKLLITVGEIRNGA
ncbi:MAG: DUF4431 domain-containing protein [Desulfobulbaceae bacterium]|nr:DUF4431 domain-containing protein [Desulfobulbaceae bacterium]